MQCVHAEFGFYEDKHYEDKLLMCACLYETRTGHMAFFKVLMEGTLRITAE